MKRRKGEKVKGERLRVKGEGGEKSISFALSIKDILLQAKNFLYGKRKNETAYFGD